MSNKLSKDLHRNQLTSLTVKAICFATLVIYSRGCLALNVVLSGGALLLCCHCICEIETSSVSPLFPHKSSQKMAGITW